MPARALKLFELDEIRFSTSVTATEKSPLNRPKSLAVANAYEECDQGDIY